MKTAKRALSLILSLMLVLGTVAVGGVSVSAEYPLPESVDIIYDSDYQNGPIVITENKTIELKGVTIEGTDVDPSPITIEPGVTLNIILSGENTLTAKSDKNSAGIYVKRDASDPDNIVDAVLNIYGREGGKLTVTGGHYGAAIGGVRPAGTTSSGAGTPGVINIYSGEIYAQGGSDGSGIGSGRSASGNEINILGGDITALSGNGGAGIGTGYATSGSAYDGVGSYSAGIINITGGRVRAAAGKFKSGFGFNDFDADNTEFFFENCYESYGFGAGIGGGYGANGCTITIGGNADVIALGSCGGTGIGSGRGTYKPGNYDENCTPYDITIEGNAKVVAAAPDDPRNNLGGGAAIGGGRGFDDGGYIEILDNANVTAVAEAYAAAIGGSWKPGDINTNDNTLIARPWHLKIAHTATVKAVSDGFTSAIGYRVGEKIEYGTYPQSKVSDEDLIAALNALAPENFDDWTSYGYYSGTDTWYDGEMKPGDFMRYYDAVLDGAKYRAVLFSAYRPYYTDYANTGDHSYQDDNGYNTDTVYWFKFEPIEWRVLDPDKGFIVCNSAIDAQAYNNYIIKNGTDGLGNIAYWGDSAQTYYANNYAENSIRQWLNDDFINTAFSASQQENILITALNNDAYPESYSEYNSAQTNDKVFLLSYAEATNPAYGFDAEKSNADTARRIQGSDYAKCQGLWVYSSGSSEYNGNSFWWLRSPGSISYSSCYVGYGGHVYHICINDDHCYGVRPAMCLNELKSDPTGAELGLREGDFIYTVSNGKATIIGYTAEDTEENYVITVPATLGGYPVAAIQGHVFKGRYYLSNLVIEGDIESIGPSAFEYCSNLGEVIFEGDVGSIGDSAFKDCDVLHSVFFKGGLEAIGENAFYRCPLSMGLGIPDGVETIGKNAFNGSGLREVYIPASVTTIAEGAFNTPGLTDVYYGSDAEDWNAINISETNNDPLFGATMHFNTSFFHITKELVVSPSPDNATTADKVTLLIVADGNQMRNPLTVFIYDAAGNELFRNEAVAFERYLSNRNLSFAYWELDPLDPGYYTAFAEYYENSDGKIYRYTGECSFSVKGIGLTCSDITYGETAEISAKLLPDAQGTVTFRFDEADTGVEVAVENGEAVLSVERLSPGNYTVEAEYLEEGDEGHATASGCFEVAKAPLTIKAKDATLTYNGEEQGYDYAIYNNPDEISEVIEIDGLKYEDAVTSVTLNGVGKVASHYDITPMRVSVNDGGEENYEITYEPGTLFINKANPALTVSAEDVDYGQTAVVTATLPNDAGGCVDFLLDESDTYERIAVINGVAKCEYKNLQPCGHKVLAVYSQSCNYNDKTDEVTFTVNSVDCALTINYVYADGTEAAETYTDSVEIFKDYSVTSPKIEGCTPDIATVEGTMGDEDMNGKTVTVTYTANTYKVTYVVDGEKLTEMDATFGQSVPRPRTPQREGYSFKWVDEIPATMPAQDVTINGKFTVIEYTATFVDENGETVEKVTFTVETESITEPDVPEKAGYTGEWEEYTLGTSNITIRPVYKGIASVEIEDFEEQSESGYKEDKTFTADASDLPEGAEIHWFVNGEDVGTGESCTVEDPTEDYTVQAKVIDKDGNVLDESSVAKVTVKNGFFDRLKAFFAELIEKILGKAIAELLTSIC